MKTKVRLERLKAVLPQATREALQAEGFFDDQEAYVKRLAFVAEVKALKEGERAVERYISTRDVDRDKEVLDPAGAILDQFKLAPQVLWAHDYSLPPIGKAEWVRADDNGLRSKTIYAETPRAEEVWQLIKGGFLATASVGFIPVKRIWKGDPEWADTVGKYNTKWSTDLEKAGAEVITTKWLLLEYSDVPVPANPHALITAIAKGLKLSDELLEDLELPDPADTTGVVEEGTPAVKATDPIDVVQHDGATDDKEPEAEEEAEPITTTGFIRRYGIEPPEAMVEETEPDTTGITRPITLVRAAPEGLLRPVKVAPREAEYIAHIAQETLAQLRGKV